KTGSSSAARSAAPIVVPRLRSAPKPSSREHFAVLRFELATDRLKVFPPARVPFAKGLELLLELPSISRVERGGVEVHRQIHRVVVLLALKQLLDTRPRGGSFLRESGKVLLSLLLFEPTRLLRLLCLVAFPLDPQLLRSRQELRDRTPPRLLRRALSTERSDQASADLRVRVFDRLHQPAILVGSRKRGAPASEQVRVRGLRRAPFPGGLHEVLVDPQEVDERLERGARIAKPGRDGRLLRGRGDDLVFRLHGKQPGEIGRGEIALEQVRAEGSQVVEPIRVPVFPLLLRVATKVDDQMLPALGQSRRAAGKVRLQLRQETAFRRQAQHEAIPAPVRVIEERVEVPRENTRRVAPQLSPVVL